MSDGKFDFGDFSTGTQDSERTNAVLIDALVQPGHFRPDTRFSASEESQSTGGAEPQWEISDPASNPVADAYADGFAAGHRQATLDAEAHAVADANARAELKLAFQRMDEAMEETLRLRLRETVVALCEAAIAPFALDREALQQRIETATAMLTRAEDERVIHVHPDDLGFIDKRLLQKCQARTDRTLERGTVRIETASGGVEDGPAVWRRAISEALLNC